MLEKSATNRHHRRRKKQAALSISGFSASNEGAKQEKGGHKKAPASKDTGASKTMAQRRNALCRDDWTRQKQASGLGAGSQGVRSICPCGGNVGLVGA